MISRRNIRVKVMQTVYTLSTLENKTKPVEAIKLLQRHFDQSRELLFYFAYVLTEIAGYAETDSYVRSNKHLPTTEDLNVNTKIAGNEILWKLKENPSFQQQLSKVKPDQKLDRELIRKIYHNLEDTAQYKQYIRTNERNHNQEKEILELILNDLLLADEVVISHIEENFINWDDDADMIIQTLKNFLQKPSIANFNEVISADKWEFAKNLLTTFLEKEQHLETFIIPKLKNWDPERIAALDMIIMKLGVAEFLYFETIPPKVTINEYIDIAKEYSTQQSGQFVNGILDNIHKELAQQNKLHKIDFKKA
jgi:transcription antitermination protein NusB